MLCFELELENNNFFYIDGHNKQLWPHDSIPEMFFNIMTDVKSSLTATQITIRGNIARLQSYNDTKHIKLMTEFINAFSKSTGKVIVKAAVFERGHLMMAAINHFNRTHKPFVCTLKTEEYKGIKDFELMEDFKLLKKYEPYSMLGMTENTGDAKFTLEWVCEAKYNLHDKGRNKTQPARTALVVKFTRKKAGIIPIITNLNTEVEIEKVGLLYFKKLHNDNIFINISETTKSSDTKDTQKASPTDRPNPQSTVPLGKKGISIRPKIYEEAVIPPYSRVRTMSDDIGEKK